MPTISYQTSDGKNLVVNTDNLSQEKKDKLKLFIKEDLVKKSKLESQSDIQKDTASGGSTKEEPIGFVDSLKNNALALKKGYHGVYGQHLLGTLANIPGMFLSDEVKAGVIQDIESQDKLGDDEPKSTIKNMYKALKKAENTELKKAEKIDSKIPNNFWTKFYAGVGASPGLIAMYGGPQALVSAIPKLAPFAGAIAVGGIDALSKADEGVVESLTAGAKGAVLGKYMDLASSLAPLSRITSLGALGYGSAEGDLEQRLANGLTFAALGGIGPRYGQKTFLERETAKVVEKAKQSKFVRQFEKDVDVVNKNLSASIDSYNLLADKKSALQKDLAKLEKVLKNKNTKADTRIKAEQRIANIKTEIRSTSASQGKLKKQLDILDDFLVHNQTFVNRVNREGTDYRTPTQAKLDAVRLDYETKIVKNKKTGEKVEVKVPKPIRAYSDLKDSLFMKVRKGILPKEFLNEYPVFKRYVDEYNLYRISVEDMVLKVLDNAKIVSTKGLTALRKGKLEPSEGGMLVRFNRLSSKEKEDLVTKTFDIERQYEIWSSTSKDKRSNKFDKDGVASRDYLNELGFSNEQVLAYRDVMNGFETIRKYYNSMAKQYGGYRIAALSRRPNFFPHIFTGNYRVYVSVNKELIDALPTTTEVGAKLLTERLKKKIPNAEVNYKLVERNKGSDDTVAAFSNVLQHLERTKSKDTIVNAIKKEYDEVFSKAGFNIHKLPRKKFSNVSGFLGTKAGRAGVDDYTLAIKLYVEGAVKTANGFRLRNNIRQFAQSRVRPDSRQTLEMLYPKSTKAGKEYVENALGLNATKISSAVEAIERSISPSFKGLYTKTAALANHFYLLQLNARFAIAQGLQPYQMIPPKLAHLSQLAGKDNVTALSDAYLTVALMQKQLVAPDKFSQKMIETAVRNRTINDNFLREFAGEGYYKQGKFSDARDVATRIKNITSGRALASNIEQYSRLNAVLMFGHHLKRLGVSEEKAIEQAWRLADKYMVRYDLAERPFIYQQLGTVGRAAGLFKTFMHNYHAQLIEAIKNSKRGDSAQLLGMVASSAVVSGLTGALFVKSADQVVGWTNKLTDSNIPTLSMFLLQAGLPDWAIFGVPSSVTGLDLTATVAAPDINPLDFISFPGYDFGKDIVFGGLTLADYYLNYNLGKLVTKDESALFGIPPATSEVRDAWKKLTPNSLHGAIELWFEKNSKNPFYTSDQNAKIQRQLKDWFARFMSSYSLREAMTTKLIYNYSVSDRNAALTKDKLADFIAENLFKFDFEGPIVPEWAYEEIVKLGYTPESLIESVKSRVKNMQTTAIQKMLKGGIKDKRELEKINTFLDNLNRLAGEE
jgi:hypothetical protein